MICFMRPANLANLRQKCEFGKIWTDPSNRELLAFSPCNGYPDPIRIQYSSPASMRGGVTPWHLLSLCRRSSEHLSFQSLRNVLKMNVQGFYLIGYILTKGRWSRLKPPRPWSLEALMLSWQWTYWLRCFYWHRGTLSQRNSVNSAVEILQRMRLELRQWLEDYQLRGRLKFLAEKGFAAQCTPSVLYVALCVGSLILSLSLYQLARILCDRSWGVEKASNL